MATWAERELPQKQSQLAGQWQARAKDPLADMGLDLVSLSVRDLNPTSTINA